MQKGHSWVILGLAVPWPSHPAGRTPKEMLYGTPGDGWRAQEALGFAKKNEPLHSRRNLLPGRAVLTQGAAGRSKAWRRKPSARPRCPEELGDSSEGG